MKLRFRSGFKRESSYKICESCDFELEHQDIFFLIFSGKVIGSIERNILAPRVYHKSKKNQIN